MQSKEHNGVIEARLKQASVTQRDEAFSIWMLFDWLPRWSNMVKEREKRRVLSRSQLALLGDTRDVLVFVNSTNTT